MVSHLALTCPECQRCQLTSSGDRTRRSAGRLGSAAMAGYRPGMAAQLPRMPGTGRSNLPETTPPPKTSHAAKSNQGDRYGRDVLSTPVTKPQLPEVAAETGLVVEDVETGWCGAVVRTEKTGGIHLVVLEDRRGRVRSFPLGPGFWVDGIPVRLVAPRPAGSTPVPTNRLRSASGS